MKHATIFNMLLERIEKVSMFGIKVKVKIIGNVLTALKFKLF